MEPKVPTLSASTAHEFDTSTATRFLEDGFVRGDEAIEPDELEALRRMYDWCFSDDAKDKVDQKALGGTDAHGPQALPQVIWPSRDLPQLNELKYHKTRKKIAATVFQDDVSVLGEHMINEPAQYGIATPWHQDQAYHDPAFTYRGLDFWLPLDGATLEDGCMLYSAGSHRGAMQPHEHLEPGNIETALVALGQDHWSQYAIRVQCPVGSCALHHSYTLHYAGPNRSEYPR